MAKRRRQPAEDRAAEYIDSPLMTQRLRYRKYLSARIAGMYGVYRTRVRLSRSVNGECTCPSEWWPCKHVRALRATWEENPTSFLDLDGFLRDLLNRPKTELIEAIGKMIIASPECLGALGVRGFEAETEDQDELNA